MLEHEVPFTRVLHKVLIPTETWPDQDMRKCIVLLYAAKWANEPWPSRFFERAEFFFEACVKDLTRYRTCTLTRPVVLMMTNAYMRAYFQARPCDRVPLPDDTHAYGRPRRFKAQLYGLQKVRQLVRMAVVTLRSTMRRRALP